MAEILCLHLMTLCLFYLACPICSVLMWHLLHFYFYVKTVCFLHFSVHFTSYKSCTYKHPQIAILSLKTGHVSLHMNLVWFTTCSEILMFYEIQKNALCYLQPRPKMETSLTGQRLSFLQAVQSGSESLSIFFTINCLFFTERSSQFYQMLSHIRT